VEIIEYGDPDGIPLVVIPGTPEKASACAPFHESGVKHGLRLLCVTRPWYDDKSVEPSFDLVESQTIEYLKQRGIHGAFALGGSGGGPFALYLALKNDSIFKRCYLLASMGLPAPFVTHAKSSATRKLLELFQGSNYSEWMSALGAWKVDSQHAHGAWADFSVLHGDWSKFNLDSACGVEIYHGKDDPNAPYESIQALAALLRNVSWHITDDADHITMAQSDVPQIVDMIFGDVASAAAER